MVGATTTPGYMDGPSPTPNPQPPSHTKPDPDPNPELELEWAKEWEPWWLLLFAGVVAQLVAFYCSARMYLRVHFCGYKWVYDSEYVCVATLTFHPWHPRRNNNVQRGQVIKPTDSVPSKCPQNVSLPLFGVCFARNCISNFLFMAGSVGEFIACFFFLSENYASRLSFCFFFLLNYNSCLPKSQHQEVTIVDSAMWPPLEVTHSYSQSRGKLTEFGFTKL